MIHHEPIIGLLASLRRRGIKVELTTGSDELVISPADLPERDLALIEQWKPHILKWLLYQHRPPERPRYEAPTGEARLIAAQANAADEPTMPCPQCALPNPVGGTHCFACRTPLSEQRA